jgi:two-component system, OmpR family, sensor kinase
MIGRSLTSRAILAASAAIVVALVVVGLAVDILIGRHLHRSLDRSLRARAVEVAQLAATAPALLTSPGSLDAPLGGEQLSVEVVDRHGRIVARSLALGGRVLPTIVLTRRVGAAGSARYANVLLGSEHLRVFAAPLANTGGAAAGGVVAVAASTDDIADTLRSVHIFVLAAALAAAAAAASALVLLMRRALSPLARLTDSAAEIARTSDARKRLPEPGGEDEVARLATTLNGMLAALERSRDAERRFLADASHEIRTPLTALRGNVAHLARHGASDELVADLQHDTRRLAGLADDLLVLSREEVAPPADERVRLDELARAVEGARVLADEPVTVLGDRAALARALENLVENAREHGSGRVTVEAAALDGVASLTVTDEGPGLRADEAAAAFERFWRGRSEGRGSGLGLAIVRATAERHGGAARAEGARFTIELPVFRDPSESADTTNGERREKGSP